MEWPHLQKQEYQIKFRILETFKEFQLSITFLTILPFGRIKEPLPKIENACWAFPLCGAFIGGLTYCVLVLTSILSLSITLSAILAIATGIIITGGIHEDGLADSADGILGGNNINSRLKIMKDSRIGTFGLLTVLIFVLIRIDLLTYYPISFYGFLGFIAISAISRLGMVSILFFMEPAKVSGLGNSSNVSNTFIYGLTCLLTLPFFVPLFQVGIFMIMIFIVALIIIIFFAKRKINGHTGDLCGATQQIIETVCSFIFVINL